MRQLGARLPVPPPDETDVVETPQNVPPPRPAEPPAPREIPKVEAYPVERHRIEPQAVDSGPAAPPPPKEAVPAAREREEGKLAGRMGNSAGRSDGAIGQPGNPAGQAASPAGRWAEFHEFRQVEPGRGRRLNLEPMLQQDDQSWVRPRMQREREHHFPFLTLAVPGFAAILAVGALLWSGSLRDRVHQQDAAMSALQEQNQKLADTLAQMNVDQKVAGALDGNATSTNPTAADGAQKAADGTTPTSPQPQNAPPAAPQAAARGEQVPANQPQAAAPQPENVREPGNRGAGNRQGVSTPPPMGQAGRASRQQTGSRYRSPVQAGYTPELVPPYPTHFQPQNVATNAAASQPAPSAGAYKPAVTVSSETSSGGARSGTASTGTVSPRTGQAAPQTYVPPVSMPSSSTALSASQTAVPQSGASRPMKPNVGRSAPSSAPDNAAVSTYNATADGSYASPLAQNIEAVEGLQRHSQVPLREFHADAGRIAKVTPSLGVSVRHPDPGHGTYALLVNEGGNQYQLAGRVNSPLTLTDTATHREYALVVLRVDDREVYGYVRPMQ